MLVIHTGKGLLIWVTLCISAVCITEVPMAITSLPALLVLPLAYVSKIIYLRLEVILLIVKNEKKSSKQLTKFQTKLMTYPLDLTSIYMSLMKQQTTE